MKRWTVVRTARVETQMKTIERILKRTKKNRKIQQNVSEQVDNTDVLKNLE